MDSFLDNINELVALMHLGELDHRDWLSELENSVKENLEFTLASDVHQCKFGQWYDTYKPRTLTETRFLPYFPARMRASIASPSGCGNYVINKSRTKLLS